MVAIVQTGGPPNLKVLAIGLALILAAIAWLVLYLLRRFFKDTREGRKSEMTAPPRGVIRIQSPWRHTPGYIAK